MADAYAVILARTASATLPIGSVNADAGSPETNIEIFYLSVSSLATPATARYQLVVQRCTTAGTGTAVTPTALSYGAPGASSTDAYENHTVSPTLTAGAYLLSEGFHQGSTFKFWAASGRGLGLPATASNGVAFLTPLGPAASVVLTAHFSEGA